MKLSIQFILLIFTISIQAQDFKPYKVKSGKIVYEKLNYSTVFGFSSVNGVESDYSKQVPYVAEQMIYYWDEFGDIAFEEIYQVSTFGGKPLPERVKIAERLWVDEHRYYFDVEKNTVSDDPYHLRIKCKENFQYYQIKGSWIETQYLGAEKSGTKEILGKEADYYKIDAYQDLYAWKGLVLRQEDFATTRKGERLDADRTTIAVEIDTLFEIDKKQFDPIWLKRDKLYNSLNGNKITEILDARPDLLTQADNIFGIQIQKNDILLFVTTELKVGKLKVLSFDEKIKMTIKYTLFDFNYSITKEQDSWVLDYNRLFDIDSQSTEIKSSKELDFKWGGTEKPIFFPQNNISVFLLNESRKKINQ